MMTFLKSILCYPCLSLLLGLVLIQKGSAQVQNFETPFAIKSFPEEFLPGWYGNDVRATSSRIFQSPNLGIQGSEALAVQPISTFNGILWIRLTDLAPFKKVSFWARSMQNGSGNRAAEVYFSWGTTLEGIYSQEEILGNSMEFTNEDQAYRKFVLDLPEMILGKEEAFLKMEIRYGEGVGSTAKWMMDEFAFGEVVVDSLPPKVLNVKGYGPREILVQFDEPVDPVYSLLPPVYGLDGKNPDFIRTHNDSSLILSMENELLEGETYLLQVSGLPDISGNVLADTVVQFTFLDPTAIEYKSVVINELMPAPKADLDLPNVEYVELWNPTAKEWRLSGAKLSNSRSSSSLVEFWIGPGEFVLLVPRGQKTQFLASGRVIEVADWPALLNSGDLVKLSTSENSLVDQISFDTSSWGDSDKAGSGFSLEVVNPFVQCDNSSFLQSSKDPKRGTPNQQNSVFDENFYPEPPRLMTAFFIDSMRIQLGFSGPFQTPVQPSQVVLTPSIPITRVSVQDPLSLEVWLEQPALPNVVFQVKVIGLEDCLGNPAADLESVKLIFARKAAADEVILNELLFDPIAGDPKFVEIANRSEEYLSLEGWALANLDEKGLPAQSRIFGEKGLVLEPKGFLAISTSSEQLKIRYPKSQNGMFLEIPSLPSYPISGGTVVLVTPDLVVAESFSYSEDLHHPLVRNTKGVSLERVSAENLENWQSASGNEEFATPGRKNSQNLDQISEGEIVSITPEVFDPEGSLGPNFVSIRYRLPDPGWYGTFQLFTASGHQVRILSQNQNLGTSGELIWQGVDQEGQRVKPGYYVLLAELYHLNGETKVIKKTLVVAASL